MSGYVDSDQGSLHVSWYLESNADVYSPSSSVHTLTRELRIFGVN